VLDEGTKKIRAVFLATGGYARTSAYLNWFAASEITHVCRNVHVVHVTYATNIAMFRSRPLNKILRQHYVASQGGLF
jgi:hypothetical protein